ncbi:phosphodiester glycosidase family protein [Neogemmobacter tilapiae]|uniref:Phosphodiester glycosidase domain-containing protein n=1 Tax=Neogemmobacter tilapiae TaxID=875041 RepID=A0A918TPA1_9RHOB|nr:hypothetical protein GCM10007315_19880 [Gemmobacter tilapiae]
MLRRIRTKFLALAFASAVPSVALADCSEMVFEQVTYTICRAKAGQDIRVFHSGADGQAYRSFDAVQAMLSAKGQQLGWAMNAGMYHSDRGPVGLLIEDGVEKLGVMTREGPGNFGMLPNGVFCVMPDRLAVIESRAYAENPPACRHASQSGPMLVIDGALHPRFLPDSDSYKIRNGVGVSADAAEAIFALSEAPVNFHTFARFFRDELGLPNALYFDGTISRLFAPDLGRDDRGVAMGPMVGLVVPKG